MSSDPNDKGEKRPKSSQRAGLRLGPGIEPTESLLKNKKWMDEQKKSRNQLPAEHEELLGPYFRVSAPFRAKLSPPHEEGEVLVIKGRVWSHDDKGGLVATIDVWQTDSGGHYDNEEDHPAAGQPFVNRARLRCDDDGYYEFETVRPGAYKRGDTQHAAHIHFRVVCSSYVTCVTQLLFSDDEHLEKDPYRECSTVIDLTEKERNGKTYKEGVFNIVLAADA